MVWILGQHRDLFAHAEILHTVMHDGAVVVWHREIGNTGGDFEVVPFKISVMGGQEVTKVRLPVSASYSEYLFLAVAARRSYVMPPKHSAAAFECTSFLRMKFLWLMLPSFLPLTLYDSAHDDFDEVISVCPALLVMKSDDVTELVGSRILASSSQRHLRFRVALPNCRPATFQFHNLCCGDAL